MSDARWIEVEADFASAIRYFRLAVEHYEVGGFDSTDPRLRFRAEAAVQMAIQSGYTSLESGMERVLELLGEAKPVGSSYHADLVRRLSRSLPGDRPALFDDKLFAQIDELRRFRHVVRHNYDNFNFAAAQSGIEAAASAGEALGPALLRFREILGG